MTTITTTTSQKTAATESKMTTVPITHLEFSGTPAETNLTGVVTPKTREQAFPGTTLPNTVLDDLQVIQKHGKTPSFESVMNEALAHLSGSKLKTTRQAPVTDQALNLVMDIVDPDGTSMEEDVARRLTKLFVSKEFDRTNFPMIPAKVRRRLKYIAQAKGFQTVRHVLLVLAHGHKLKNINPLDWDEALENIFSIEGPIRSQAAEQLMPVIKLIGSQLKKQERLLSGKQLRAHRGSLYTNRTIFSWNGQRMSFDQSFGAPSLLETMVEGVRGPQDYPVSFQIVNTDPQENPLPNWLIRRFNEAGIAVFKEKAGVPVISPSVPAGERFDLMKRFTNEAGDIDWPSMEKIWDKLTPAGAALVSSFEKRIDSAYIPSLITSPIEPESYRRTPVVFSECCAPDGRSLKMDGGGWIPPFHNGKVQPDMQVRMSVAMGGKNMAYVKGMGFVKWDACLFRHLRIDSEGNETPVTEWDSLWLQAAREQVCHYMGVTDSEFREQYWEAAKACTKGYPNFRLETLCNDVREVIEFQMMPVVDINQVKGLMKARVKQEVADNSISLYEHGFMGALRLEGGFSTMDMCFEALMWADIDFSDEGEVDPTTGRRTYKCPTKNAINSSQLELADKLVDEGLKGLEARAAQQDEGIEMMLKVLGRFNDIRRASNHEAQLIEWWMIPTLRSRIWRSLERIMYHGADGGGISCPQVVFQLCDLVEAGTSVYTSCKPGEEVVSYRFPMATHTAMMVTTVADSKDHPELWADPWGYIPKTRQVMNHFDLVHKGQGDDDGDKGGCTNDPRIVAMAQNTWETRTVDIEVQLQGVEAEKYNEGMWDVRRNIPLDEEGRVIYHPTPGETYPQYTSGLELAARSQRGQVGRTTRLQQRLHALMWRIEGEGHVEYPKFGERTIALAWPNQGEIDIEKKQVLRVNIGKVLAQGLFTQVFSEGEVRDGALHDPDANGVWQIKPELINQTPGGYDVDALSMVVTQDYLVRQGCFSYDTSKVVDSQAQGMERYRKNVGDPIEWCKSDKRIDLNSDCWEGATEWKDGGLRIDSVMHWSFRNMETIWNEEIKKAFQLPDHDVVFDFGEVLVQTLIDSGREVVKRGPEWFNNETYDRYQKLMGCTDYRKMMRESYRIARSEDSEDQAQDVRAQAAIRQQQVLMERPLQDFADLWALEHWRWGELTGLADDAEIEGNTQKERRFRKAAEGCLNSMVRLINFPESPVAQEVGISMVETCDFLTKARKDDILGFCYDKSSRKRTFSNLTSWIKKNGHHHVQVQDANAQSKHMTACPYCMAQAKQLMVGRFRKDTRSVSVRYFADLNSYLNHTGQYKS